MIASVLSDALEQLYFLLLAEGIEKCGMNL